MHSYFTSVIIVASTDITKAVLAKSGRSYGSGPMKVIMRAEGRVVIFSTSESFSSACIEVLLLFIVEDVSSLQAAVALFSSISLYFKLSSLKGFGKLNCVRYMFKLLSFYFCSAKQRCDQ